MNCPFIEWHVQDAMISNFHTHAHINRNPEEDHNLLSIPQNMVLATQLHNYKISSNIT